ncbi:deoxyribodipyrimidine photo-lyase [Patescibacteria group bacterium]|nr:deoxyribodipyrimidine photo-lyase [Patescibacteria group bacterium]
MHQKTLFIHRRDLRVHDNTGLAAAVARSEAVVPCFIFDPRQVGEANAYKSERAVAFMAESLKELAESYTAKGGVLQIFEGEAHEVVKRLIQEEGIDAVFVNLDYTPFSQERDEKLRAVCEEHRVTFEGFHDLMLSGDPDDPRLKTQHGEPYKVFTPFFKNASASVTPERPTELTATNLFGGHLRGSDHDLLDQYRETDIVFPTPPGRSGCLSILKEAKRLKNYKDTRDLPSERTSRLSAHNKFGTCSVREVYAALKHELGAGHELLRQLYWRDFFIQLSYHFPHVYGSSFNAQYDAVRWEQDETRFAAWCEGRTGVPIVDAGMRELNATGYMHNRCRMIVASFLTKDLHLDWRWGERYFAQKLVDYDPAVNNGSWQWAAGTGADAAPYFRIFNPWLQGKKFDPDCAYTKTWLPELADLDPSLIHALDEKPLPDGVDYPTPLVDHRAEAAKAKELYGSALQNVD